MDEIDDDVNKLVKIGGTALLGSSLFAAGTVAVGRSQMAKRMYSEGKKNNIDAKMAHEGRFYIQCFEFVSKFFGLVHILSSLPAKNYFSS